MTNPLKIQIGDAIRGIKAELLALEEDKRIDRIRGVISRLEIPVVINSVIPSPSANEREHWVDWHTAEGGENEHQWFSFVY